MTTYLEFRENEIFSKQQSIIKQLGITSPLILDVGANQGQSLMAYRQIFPVSTFHAFEPNPEAADIFDQAWKNDPHVTLHRTCLADCKGMRPFYRTAIQEVSSLLPPSDLIRRLSASHRYEYEIIEVPVTTLDRFFSESSVFITADIMKIDVQGSELQVLKGASKTLAAQSVSLIYTEIIHAETYDGQTHFTDLLLYLESHNYCLWDILPFVYTKKGQIWYSNAIFLSKKAVKVILAL